MAIFDLGPALRWVVGVAMALLNSLMSSSGYVVLRRAELDRRALEASGAPLGVVQSRALCLAWLSGVVLYTTASIPDIIAYMLVPQIVCSTISCLRLVMVTLLAYFLLGEHVGRREAFGMVLCTFGALLCMAFGPKAEDSTYDDPILFLAGKKAAYLAVGFPLLVVGLLLSTRLTFRFWAFPLTEALGDGLEHILITAVGFASSPAALLSEPVWWLVFLGIGCLAVMVFVLNIRGAKIMPVNVFVPMSFAFRTVIQFFQAAFVLDEFAHLPARYTALSVIGACAALLGAIFIQPPGAVSAGLAEGGEKSLSAHLSTAGEVEVSTNFAAHRGVEGAWSNAAR